MLHGQPGSYRITGPGLAAIGSNLPAPRVDRRCYGHDIGVAWLWLAASHGTFGPVQRVVYEHSQVPLLLRSDGVGAHTTPRALPRTTRRRQEPPAWTPDRSCIAPAERQSPNPRKAGRGAARGDMPNRGAKAGQDGEVPDTPD
jgi:hypothetical protein